MEYNQTTRNKLYEDFLRKKQPGGITFGSKNKQVALLMTNVDAPSTDEELELHNTLHQELYESKLTPGVFYGKKYSKVVEFCAGDKAKAKALLTYFDKLNKFSYSTGWGRRLVRTSVYIKPTSKVRNILQSAYHMQLYNTSFSKYILNQMPEEYLDYKKHCNWKRTQCLEDLVAAYIDAGDTEIIQALKTVITCDNNVAALETYMIRGIIKSSNQELHKLLGKLLLAARLQEGLRQSICESMDCGTHEAFCEIFRVIDENNLMRFSSVRRAIATLIGVIDPDHLVRTSDKTFALMKECVYNKESIKKLLDTDDALSLMVGLWGLGIHEVNDAIKVMIDFMNNGSIQKKRVAAFFNINLHDEEIQRKFANTAITNSAFDRELAAAIFPTYMNNCHQEIRNAAGIRGYNQARLAARSVNLSLWFKERDTAIKHYNILSNLLSEMKEKNYEYKPFLFPWYSTSISRSDVLLRMCVIANGLEDYNLMDSLADNLSEMDGQTLMRQKGVLLLLSRPKTPRLKRALIDSLGDKESLTRKEAFEIAKNTKFTPEEYDYMCQLLRFKAADLRKNVITILKRQKDDGLYRSIQVLLNANKEEMRLAGLDILLSLDKGTKNHSNTIALLNNFENPTDREKILLNQLLGNGDQSVSAFPEKESLYGKDDNIDVPKVEFNKGDYPLFSITKEELNELFKKLDDLIYEHRNDEVKTCTGETVLLGAKQTLPIASYNQNPELRTPLIEQWKEFYKTEIKTPERLMAMHLSLCQYASINSFNSYTTSMQQPYNQYLKTLMESIFGKPIIAFDPTSYRFGRSGNLENPKTSGAFFKAIINALVMIFCPKDYYRQIGYKVVLYLCGGVPKDKTKGSIVLNSSITSNIPREYTSTPITLEIINTATVFFAEDWGTKENFKNRFNVLLKLEDLYDYDENRRYSNGRDLVLKPMDYAVACYYGLITEPQMYKKIITSKDLRGNLQNLFMLYRVDRYPYLAKHIERYGFNENPELKEFVYKVADEVSDTILRIECKRGDSPTPYSEAVTSIEHVCGTRHLVQLLIALGKDKFARSEYLSWNTKGDRKTCLSHLISVCHPLPGEDVNTLKDALKGTSINEKRLIETAMYAPQWLDIIEEYLGYEGLKSGCYYFMAHMNDHYSKNEKKNAIISRYTPLEKEELLNGAFDVNWFKEAYDILGEKKFQLLYDAAKYISDGSKHSRARKYADAALGRVTASDLETEIKAKRNKDLLMSYALVPLSQKEDMLHRYEFIQQFRKESLQFGSQRKASEGLASDMALKNLSITCGFQDVTRLTLAMEMELVKSLSGYFEWHALDDITYIRIEITTEGKPDIVIKKGEKLLSSVPSAFKKDEYVAELKETIKKFRLQYSRTVKMFELAMEEREFFSFNELSNLCQNPVTKPIVENLVFISDDGTCATVTYKNLIDVRGSIVSCDEDLQLRPAHPIDLYESGTLSDWQKIFFKKQQETGFKQPFRQVFRELYVKLDEEKELTHSFLFAGHQIQPSKTVGCLKNRRWIADYETGLGKIFYKDNIVVKMYALADWFSPSDIEAPTLEWVEFQDRKTFEVLSIDKIPNIVYSEAMRDIDLAVSVAHAGNVDPEATHSTIEMRKAIAECNIQLFGLKNVDIKGNHALISGSLGEYSIHLGSGVIHMIGAHQLNVLPVHSQHRGRIFLPFLDDDPKTAEIISKILLFAEDKKIKDPYILNQIIH